MTKAIFAVMVIVGSAIACSSTSGGSGGGGGGSGADGGGGGGGGGGSLGSDGTHTCVPPKTTCAKCVYDTCANACSACDADPGCLDATSKYSSCVANLKKSNPDASG